MVDVLPEATFSFTCSPSINRISFAPSLTFETVSSILVMDWSVSSPVTLAAVTLAVLTVAVENT